MNLRALYLRIQAIILPLLLNLEAAELSPRPGALDLTFNPAGLWNDIIRAVAVQADDRIVVGATFTAPNGTDHPELTRFHPDGVIDHSFQTPSWLGGVYALATDSEGRFYLATNPQGEGATRQHVVRLDASGAADGEYGRGLELDGLPHALALQPDGRLVIGGDFTRVQGASRPGIARLNEAGALDPVFDPGPGVEGTFATVYAVAVQRDGRVLVGGRFSRLRGEARPGLGRLQPNGDLDAEFAPSLNAPGSVSCIVVQGDRRILIGGAFTAVDGVPRRGIARLEPDGALDPTFEAGFDSDERRTVYTILLEQDGTMFVGGHVQRDHGSPGSLVLRLASCGKVDPGFFVDAVNSLQGMARQADGKLIVVGEFTEVDNQRRHCVARIHGPATAIAPPVIELSGRWSSHCPELSVRSTDCPQAVRVERSTDLVQWDLWTNLLAQPTKYWQADPTATNGPTVFYRAVAVP